MKVISIPVLSDNYAYLIIDEDTGDACVVDPSEAGPVSAAVRRENIHFTAIINTHHHWDHVGGNEELVKEYPDLKVYGHKKDETRTPRITHLVEDGDTTQIGKLNVRFLYIPCHTSGHVAAHFETEKCIFTGDTLFIAGCGRLFEGTAADMHDNMTKLMKLPDDTKIYCGHEYTVKNLEFALALEPNNEKIKKKLEWARGVVSRNLPTIPGQIGEEIDINPFVRVHSNELQSHEKNKFPGVGLDAVSILEKTRHLKDNF